MSAIQRTLALAAVLVFITGVVGCGSGPRLYPVTGKVTKGGAPGKGIKIDFIPDDSKLPTASAQVKEDGTYTLSAGTDGRAGAAVGKYTLRATPMSDTPPPPKPGEAPPAVAPGYMSSGAGGGVVPVQLTCTPATYEVKPQAQTVDITIE